MLGLIHEHLVDPDRTLRGAAVREPLFTALRDREPEVMRRAALGGRAEAFIEPDEEPVSCAGPLPDGPIELFVLLGVEPVRYVAQRALRPIERLGVAAHVARAFLERRRPELVVVVDVDEQPLPGRRGEVVAEQPTLAGAGAAAYENALPLVDHARIPKRKARAIACAWFLAASACRTEAISSCTT